MEIRSLTRELFPGAKILLNGDQAYKLDCADGAGRLLQFDLGKGKMLMGYSDDGAPVPLPDGIPTFWVTAPTAVATGIGVIVNADWAIDSGRANLHNSDANREMAYEMSKGLHGVLSTSWRYFQNHEDGETEEQHNRRVYAFYNGLWNVFTNLRGQGTNGVQRWNGVELGVSLLKKIVWGEGQGYRKFLNEGNAVVPTGMKDDELCSLLDIQYVVDQSVLRPEVKDQFLGAGVQNAVTENVFRMPNEVLALKQVVHTLGWRQVFENALRVHEILTPDLANGEFGRVFSSILNGFSEEGNEPTAEEQRAAEKRVAEVKDILRKFKFYSQDEQSVATADNLLAQGIVREADQEAERMKVAFTPAKVHLSKGYDKVGLSVFKCCRNPRGGIGQEQLADYAIAAEDDVKRKAVLKYLSSDDCGEQFCDRVRRAMCGDPNTWLLALHRRDRFKELTNELGKNQAMIVAARLKLEVEWDIAGTAERDELIRSATAEEGLYTKKWLDACLRLEMMEESGDDADNSRKGDREAVVTFKKMRPIGGQPNMFELSQTESQIPAWFSEEINQQLTIQLDDGNAISTVIESMSVRQYKIAARIKLNVPLDCNRVISATTRATRPKFLLEALRERYAELEGLDEGHNFRDHLPQDMRFVFGPPGTGKTTYLATEVLMRLVKENPAPHVLVLTPTNKAADVLVLRVIEKMKEAGDESYKNWLRRFGIALDPALKDDEVLCGKRINLEDGDGKPWVVATTMIRFAYDEIVLSDDGHVKKPLRDFRWDYVVIDEASMISLVQILYPLTKANGSKFIIAGDPNQIAPVVRAVPLVDQNIYKMVGLNQFENHDYDLEMRKSDGSVVRFPVHCLATQYRSIPAIGRVFDLFCYGEWNAENPRGSIRKLVDGRQVGHPVESIWLDAKSGDKKLEVRPLTILRFPVFKVEGVYKVRTIGWSSYHVYSALFIFEFIRKLIAKVAIDKKFSIGIISPYRIQSDIMARMFDQERNSKKIPEGISLQASTVHGFQGDQCDMIVALLNPPSGMGLARIADGKEIPSTINNMNILNVAMSRSKDYLIVAMPEERCLHYERLTGPRKIVDIIRSGEDGSWIEHSMRTLEQSVWNDSDYIERNTFQTGHQNVNVYVPQTMRYEVRAETSAIDIQFTDGEELIKRAESSPIETSQCREEKEDAAIRNRPIPAGFRLVVASDDFIRLGTRYFLKTDDPSILPGGRCCENEDESRHIDMRDVWAIQII